MDKFLPRISQPSNTGSCHRRRGGEGRTLDVLLGPRLYTAQGQLEWVLRDSRERRPRLLVCDEIYRADRNERIGQESRHHAASLLIVRRCHQGLARSIFCSRRVLDAEIAVVQNEAIQ